MTSFKHVQEAGVSMAPLAVHCFELLKLLITVGKVLSFGPEGLFEGHGSFGKLVKRVSFVDPENSFFF